MEELEKRFAVVKEHPSYGVNAKGEICNLKTNRILHPIPDSKGYMKVRMDGKKFSVSRLVAETFVPNPSNKPNVSYRDGDKSNLYYKNLFWASNSEIKRPDRVYHYRIANSPYNERGSI